MNKSNPSNNNLLHYSIEQSMLLQLYYENMFTEDEYLRIKNRIMNDYHIVSDITAMELTGSVA